MNVRNSMIACAVVLATGLGYATTQTKPAAGTPSVTVYKSPT